MPFLSPLLHHAVIDAQRADNLWFSLQDIINEPDEIQSYRTGAPIPRKLSVDYISFSAHVDGAQNQEFIEKVGAQHVVSLHG
jgi:Cft2 family RNA processing exonuclease